MGLLRSEPMKHGTLVLPDEKARQFIDLIGASTKMQFEDMNARTLRREYKGYIRRIDECERLLRFLMDELMKMPNAEVIKNNVNSFLDNSNDYKLDHVEARLKTIYQAFITLKENNVKLTARRNSTLEESCVVKTAIATMAQSTQMGQSTQSTTIGRSHHDADRFEFSASRSLLDDEEGASARRGMHTMFSNVAGVIPQVDQERFARALFRATRGNTYTHFQQIPQPMPDPKTGREVHKSVFVVYFQDQRMGSSTSAMRERICKICQSYGVNTYRWPEGAENAEELRKQLDVDLLQQESMLRAHEDVIRDEATPLLDVVRSNGNSLIEEWRMFCVKEKSIYATLNLFEGDISLRANCWYPEADEARIRELLIQHSSQNEGKSSAMLIPYRTPPRKSPPTYIRKNEFTSVFQDLVDTYGLPRYGEVNPALFWIVTFPFLFGVMFGDIGHGSMVLMLGIWAVWKADDLKFSMPEVHTLRYILVLMGFFGVYCGFLYNDFFSLGLNIFETRWTAPEGVEKGQIATYTPTFGTANDGGSGPYPFGLDPAWHGAQNELVYVNSLKMKCSVIVGVVHMIMGLLLRFANALHERNKVDLFFECIPMMVFMLSFFGFMDYMILYKWVTPMDNPPSIINSLISMAMWTEDPNPMFGATIPRVLMGTAILTVPLLLIPKPFFLHKQHQEAQMATQAAIRPMRNGGGRGSGGNGGRQMTSAVDEECVVLNPEKEEDEEAFDFAEICIHQVIFTIEYVLGTVSHTASYLRLWALSLAHQQLSAVFFDLIMISGMEASFPINVFMIYFCFILWFMLTVGILLGMDVMECFLHTLRLHWVEFQSKFYRADGYAFEPLSHRKLLETNE